MIGTWRYVSSDWGAGGLIGVVLRWPTHIQGAYKYGKMKFPEFSRFSRPFKKFFHTIIMLKPDATNHLTSHFGTFLALMQNIF